MKHSPMPATRFCARSKAEITMIASVKVLIIVLPVITKLSITDRVIGSRRVIVFRDAARDKESTGIAKLKYARYSN